MKIDKYLREELIEYFERESGRRLRSQWILSDLREHAENKQEIYDYLSRDFDINDEGGPNEPMRLAGQMTFEDDRDYWRSLYEGEKQAGLLESRDPDIIDEFGRKR